MSFVAFVKSKRVFLLVATLATIIIVLASAILFLNFQESQDQKDVGIIPGYSDLKQKITTVASSESGAPNSGYSRMADYFTILEKENASAKEKYDALVSVFYFLGSEYSRTNNHEYYSLINEDVDNFAKDNFPQYYEKEYFRTSCQDPSCADSNQPVELKNILEVVEKSDFPSKVKETLTEDLVNTGYKSDETEKLGKAWQYMVIAEITRGNDWYSNTGSNREVADLITKMVINNYPEEYKKFIESKDDFNFNEN